MFEKCHHPNTLDGKMHVKYMFTACDNDGLFTRTPARLPSEKFGHSSITRHIVIDHILYRPVFTTGYLFSQLE